MVGLESIQESFLPFNDLLPTSRFLVARVKVHAQQPNGDDDQTIGHNRRIDARMVRRCILASKNGRTGNSPYAAHADQASAAKGPLPLSDDVVALVRQGSRDVSVEELVFLENPPVLPKAGLLTHLLPP